MTENFKISIKSFILFKFEIKFILFWAFIIRLCSVFFSEGYGMHDDHFLIIESSSSWVDGFDYNNWLPWSPGNNGVPSGHSLTYVGLNFLYFKFMSFFGVDNPKILMIFNRLIHALWSLLAVLYAYKITLLLAEKKLALKVACFIGFTWIIPFMTVRNLVEFVPIPLMLLSIYYIIKYDKFKHFFLSGIFIGLAVSFRYQIAVFAFGIALVLLLKFKIKECVYFSLGFLVIFTITQGVVDYFIWKKPFAEFIAYSTYNMNEGTQYLKNKNYFMYVGVLSGIMLFPLGILMLIAYFISIKKYMYVFIPSFCFLLFHSLYPNRQERFILSILPFFIILGVLGYNILINKYINSKFVLKLWTISNKIFWILNIPLLLFISFTSSKISRVNAMYSLYENSIKNEKILIEASAEANPEMMPKFYGKCWSATIIETKDTFNIKARFEKVSLDYIFYFGNKNLNKRIELYKQIFPKMSLHSQCEPNLMDKTLNKINPRNSNQYIEVWKTNTN